MATCKTIAEAVAVGLRMAKVCQGLYYAVLIGSTLHVPSLSNGFYPLGLGIEQYALYLMKISLLGDTARIGYNKRRMMDEGLGIEIPHGLHQVDVGQFEQMLQARLLYHFAGARMNGEHDGDLHIRQRLQNCP